MIISAVPYPYVEDVWPKVSSMLKDAVDTSHGKFSIESVRQAIDHQEIALWVVLEEGNDAVVASFTTRIAVYPECRVLTMDWVGGERMSEWMEDMLDVMEGYAKHHKCTQMQGMGRPGWARALKHLGWELESSVYRKDLSHG